MSRRDIGALCSSGCGGVGRDDREVHLMGVGADLSGDLVRDGHLRGGALDESSEVRCRCA